MSRVLKPDSGQSLVLQDEGGTAALTIDTSGDATFAGDIKLSANKGIDFSGAQTSATEAGTGTTAGDGEILDSYEEGTFSTTGYGKDATTSLTGTYRKIGSLVTIWVFANASGSQTAGNAIYCEGLPFNASTYIAGTLGWQQRVNMEAETVANLDNSTSQFGGVTGSGAVSISWQTVKDTGNYTPYLWHYSFTYYTS